jgi:thioredoxin 1|tara:strand:+ start:1177 stop:1503 length:327 start_codon:yes stop_codon:yes gene_type:complete
MVTLLKTRAELKNHVKKHDVVIVKFKAEWCGPCKKVAPHIKTLMETFKKINYVEVDVDEGSNIASYLKIRTIPTIISYVNGDIHEILSSSNQTDITNFFKKTNGHVTN